MLTRSFIASRLQSYFSSKDVVIAAPLPLPFTTLLNRWEYRALLSQKYTASPLGWMTPVEVFKPFYSYALARYVLTQWQIQGAPKSKEPLLVFEIGGGNGTNARHFLDWLQRHSPSVYAGCQYTLLEFSSRLRDVQEAAVAAHGERARVVAADATDLQAALAPDLRPCFVIGLEVLDNLPHDKAVRLASGGPWQETTVVEAGGGDSGPVRLSEEFRPVCDPLISEALSVAEAVLLPSLTAPLPRLAEVRGRLVQAARAFTAMPWTRHLDLAAPPVAPVGACSAIYLPTGALQMLRGLRALLPRHRLVLADFDVLPPPAVLASTLQSDCRVDTYCPAHGSPLTASKDPASRDTVDHLTYLHAPASGSADIFFPTDFSFLAALVRHVQKDSKGKGERSRPRASGGAAEVQSSAQFLRLYADVERTRTITGYNPMIEDYGNTRFLLT